MNKFNRADKTLGGAFICFIFALFLTTLYPTSLFCSGLLFCCEAALVGGIADWFAVTALFKKPLGFPWHTAILPCKRAAFTDATINLIKNRFFSRKNIFNKLNNDHASERLLNYLTRPKKLQQMSSFLLQIVADQPAAIDHVQLQKQLLTKLREDSIPTDLFETRFRPYCRNLDNLRPVLRQLSSSAQDYLSSEAGRKKIEDALDMLQKEKMNNNISSFFISIGSILNIINIDECADLIQAHGKELLDAINNDEEGDCAGLRQALLQIISDALCSEQTKTLLLDFWQNLCRSTLCQNLVEQFINEGLRALTLDFSQKDVIYRALEKIIQDALLQTADDIQKEPALFRLAEELVRDILARSLLKAQSMLDDTIRSALDSLSDAQLNELIYSKISTDLIWIRMNGSIVGAVIGFFLFIIMSIIE